MIRTQVITNGKPTLNMREQFKQYASVPDNSRDALLENCLMRALLAVQASADIALLPCTLKLTVDDVAPGESFRLYQGGASIVSVQTEAGNITDYVFDGGRISLRKKAQRLDVTYTNEVILPEAEKLMPVVWQYATALYDGETPETLNTILKQVYF